MRRFVETKGRNAELFAKGVIMAYGGIGKRAGSENVV